MSYTSDSDSLLPSAALALLEMVAYPLYLSDPSVHGAAPSEGFVSPTSRELLNGVSST